MVSSSFAVPCGITGTCDPTNVTLDLVRLTPYLNPDFSINPDPGSSTNPNLLTKGPYNATSCVGMFLKEYSPPDNGNDDAVGPHPYDTIMDPDNNQNELVLNIGELLDINFDFVLGSWMLTTKPDVITQS